MSRIRDIEEFISREFANLKKSVNKPKAEERNSNKREVGMHNTKNTRLQKLSMKGVNHF